MKQYVLGFCFDSLYSQVLLIEKNRPAWQAGRLNGVGGKIESTDESPLAAMAREFEEEAGVKTTGWEQFATMHGPEWICYCFSLAGDPPFALAESTTDEKLKRCVVDNIYSRQNVISNLRWLIPLAMDLKVIKPVEFQYK